MHVRSRLDYNVAEAKHRQIRKDQTNQSYHFKLVMRPVIHQMDMIVWLAWWPRVQNQSSTYNDLNRWFITQLVSNLPQPRFPPPKKDEKSAVGCDGHLSSVYFRVSTAYVSLVRGIMRLFHSGLECQHERRKQASLVGRECTLSILGFPHSTASANTKSNTTAHWSVSTFSHILTYYGIRTMTHAICPVLDFSLLCVWWETPSFQIN